MRTFKRIISTLLLATPLLLHPMVSYAEEEAPGIRTDAPDRYTVQQGDTLWDISARFLKSPWRWPDVWGINKDAVKNPHLIYPGDIIILDLTGATPRLRLEGVDDGGQSRWAGAEKLRPQIRSQELSAAPIPTLSPRLIEPFLSRPLVLDPDSVVKAPHIVAAFDGRVALAKDDNVYVEGIGKNEGRRWNIYRQGRRFQDPDSRELLGYEGIYLGDFEVTKFGNISTGAITRATQEIMVEDRLALALPTSAVPFVPRSPNKAVRGKVVAGSDSSVGEIPPLSAIVINRGGRDGAEVGHVLGLFRTEGLVRAGSTGRLIALPEQRYGVAMIFRVFPRMSYALVLSASSPVHIDDIAQNP
ncbi:MAG: LysM peptidoglycan-binding domain-containing protein [Betaproteobacteria bacterium]|nr:LysM peptidoglycan-binding domain-containing protein [Betaproteobacteria bacterium]